MRAGTRSSPTSPPWRRNTMQRRPSAVSMLAMRRPRHQLCPDRGEALRMALPRIEPIIPARRKEPFDHPDWLFDVERANALFAADGVARERLCSIHGVPPVAG